MDVKAAKTSELVSFYNDNTPDKPVKKFRDRETAERKVIEILKKKGLVAEKPKRNREKLAGKKLYKLKPNPRREGTRAFKAFELIENGMPFEKYVELGGDIRDLKHDIKKGNLEAR